MPLLTTLLLACCIVHSRAVSTQSKVEVLGKLSATCGTAFSSDSTTTCSMPGCAVCARVDTLSPSSVDEISSASTNPSNTENCLCSLPGYTMVKHRSSGRSICKPCSGPYTSKHYNAKSCNRESMNLMIIQCCCCTLIVSCTAATRLLQNCL
jgi:hypothetical protein